MSNETATSIWSNESLALGEGPLTHHLRSSLVWCDIIGRAVYERAFDGNETRKHALDLMPSAAAIIDDHSLLLAVETGFQILDLDSGALTSGPDFTIESHMRTNDGRVHPSGAFWIGTMAKDGSGRPGAIYRFFDGELTRMIDDVVIPNSICFAADGSFAYYADTAQRTIWKIPTDPETGDVTGQREVFVKVPEDIPGGPDGSVVDAAGNLWNARWGGAALDVYSPNGQLLQSHSVPTPQPTCPAFVGRDLDSIVTTSAAIGLDSASAGDAAGTVIRVHVPVAGRSEPLVAL